MTSPSQVGMIAAYSLSACGNVTVVSLIRLCRSRIVRQDEAAMVRWGLVPRWAKDPSVGARMNNARAETIDTSPAFREVFKQKRCVIPNDGFFEWTGPKSDRQPTWIHRPDGQMLLFAGLWEAWKVRPHEYETTFTIITTTANGLMAPIHNRMPVILSPDAVDAWIDPKNEDYIALKALLVPAAENLLVTTRVSQKINSVKNDTRASLFEQPELL